MIRNLTIICFWVLFIMWLFLGITLLFYEGYKLQRDLSKEETEYDWIFYLLFVSLSFLLMLLIYK